MRKTILVLVLASFCASGFVPAAGTEAEKTELPGLVGVWFSHADLSNPKDYEIVENLEMRWHVNNSRGYEWSGKWLGFLIAPATGEVTFHVETDKQIVVTIDGKKVGGLKAGQTQQSKKVPMVAGARYPIEITYVHGGGIRGCLNVKWSWPGQDVCPIAPMYLGHTAEQKRALQAEAPVPPEKPGTVPALTVPAAHVIVYYEPGRFGGFPANRGVWNWGNEILVGFMKAYYKERTGTHSHDRSRPASMVLARSPDGGITWTVEEPANFVGVGRGTGPCPGNIDFAHPDLAIRCNDDHFSVSYNRGKTWQGPYRFPDFGTDELTSRTDYIVSGPDDCLFFLSAKEQRVQAGLQDRAFCVRTPDGGKTFKFLSWMTGEPISVRSVMPSTVRVSESHLVSAMRRRRDVVEVKGGPEIRKNWIDVYASSDDGKSWGFLSKVADTDTGKRNGSPPSMVRLKDGRLVVTYGYRARPYGIRAKISSDDGKTWSDEIGLRLDGRTWDVGYPRTVVRPDGKIVTIYYFSTDQRPEQHIAATIWDPDEVRTSSFRFTVTGDPRSGLSRWKHTLKQMTAKLGGEGAFHITAGDYFEDDHSTMAIDFYDELIKEFGEDAIWYPGVGNHEVQREQCDLFWLRLFYYEKLKGKVNPGPKGCEETTYSWDYENAHFVQLNMYWDGEKYYKDLGFTDLTLQWLEDDLDKNTKPVVFVTYHEPAWPNGRGGKESPANWARFMKILNDRKVVAGLCAHSHKYARYQVDGDWEKYTWEIDVGNAGRQSHADKHQTFVDVTVNSNGLVEFNTWQGFKGKDFKKTDSWKVRVPTTALLTTAVN